MSFTERYVCPRGPTTHLTKPPCRTVDRRRFANRAQRHSCACYACRTHPACTTPNRHDPRRTLRAERPGFSFSGRYSFRRGSKKQENPLVLLLLLYRFALLCFASSPRPTSSSKNHPKGSTKFLQWLLPSLPSRPRSSSLSPGGNATANLRTPPAPLPSQRLYWEPGYVRGALRTVCCGFVFSCTAALGRRNSAGVYNKQGLRLEGS